MRMHGLNAAASTPFTVCGAMLKPIMRAVGMPIGADRGAEDAPLPGEGLVNIAHP